jgi:hypothetical protein
MQLFLKISRKVLRQSIVVIGLILLISLSGLFILTQPPTYAVTSAANKLTPEEKIDRAYEYSEATGFREEQRQREQAYEQAKQDAQSPDSLEQAYERNLKDYNQENEPGLIEKAQELIEDVTNK